MFGYFEKIGLGEDRVDRAICKWCHKEYKAGSTP